MSRFESIVILLVSKDDITWNVRDFVEQKYHPNSSSHLIDFLEPNSSSHLIDYLIAQLLLSPH